MVEPFAYEFFRNAFAAALMVGLLCGLMGVYIVVRGMSYIGHGLSHAAFGGAVAGYLFRVNFYASAAVIALLAVVTIQRISDGRRLRADAAIGIVTTALFALGVALISHRGRFERSFEAALFGNILGVTALDLWVIGAVLVLCVGGVLALYRPLLFTAFDEETAAVFGVSVRRLRFLFSFLLALCVIASMNIVGVTMIAATLVMPAATVRMLTDSFHRMALLSPLLGAATGGTGMYVSYHLDTASGATIVLVGAMLFAAAWAYRSVLERSAHVHVHRHGTVAHAHPHGHDVDHHHGHRPPEHTTRL